MGKLMRKLNNKSGKSIFMALLLLLVAVVVSVVIVTVAITSVMHVQDNKTSQQEYLACASAADLIKDCVAGSTYTYTEMTGTYEYNKSVDYYGNVTKGTETITITPTEEVTPVKGNMENFVKKVSQSIRDIDWLNSTGEFYNSEFTITQDKMSDVNVKCKVVKYSKHQNSFLLKLKLSTKAKDDSQGYVMSMVIPLTKSKPEKPGDQQAYDCTLEYYWDVLSLWGYNYDYRSEHRETGKKGNIKENELKKHLFNITYDVTEIKWESANTTGITISKGAENYEN